MTRPIDVELEIAGLEVEQLDLKRDMKANVWIGGAVVAAIIGSGPSWLGYLSTAEVIPCLVGAVVYVGLAEKLNKIRLAQIHDQLVLLHLREHDEKAIPAEVFRREAFNKLRDIWTAVVPVDERNKAKLIREATDDDPE